MLSIEEIKQAYRWNARNVYRKSTDSPAAVM